MSGYSDADGRILRLDSYNTDRLSDISRTETGGRNFDLILDLGHSGNKNWNPTLLLGTTDLVSEDLESNGNVPFSELLTCLSVGGSIVTSKHSFALSGRDTAVLHLKSGSLHFLFSQSWMLSPLKLGYYQRRVTLGNSGHRLIRGISRKLAGLTERGQ